MSKPEITLKDKALRIFEDMPEKAYQEYKDLMLDEEFVIEHLREGLANADKEELKDFIKTYEHWQDTGITPEIDTDIHIISGDKIAKVWWSDEEQGYMYNIYETTNILHIEEGLVGDIDGGCCTGSLQDAINMAISQC